MRNVMKKRRLVAYGVGLRPASTIGACSLADDEGGRMNILEAVLGAQGGGAAAQLGQQFGLNDSQVSSALSALVPALAAGFQQHMSNPQGLEGMLSTLGGGQHQRYVDD